MPLSRESLDRIAEECLMRILPKVQGGGNVKLPLAVAIAKACVAKAEQMNVSICVSVVDEAGFPVLFNRMPGALLIGTEIAPKKAYTCAVLDMSTEEAGLLTNQTAQGLDVSMEGKIVLFAGGLPIRVGGKLIGGLGISGGAPAQDREIAEHGLRAVGLLL